MTSDGKGIGDGVWDLGQPPQQKIAPHPSDIIVAFPQVNKTPTGPVLHEGKVALELFLGGGNDDHLVRRFG